MRLALLVFVLPTLLPAQTGTSTNIPPAPSPVQPPATKPEDQCRLSGKVVSSSTGEPVKKASILLRRADLNPSTTTMPTTYATTSDTAGAFSMKDIEPGKYRLSVMRTGYVAAEYGA